MVPTTKDITIRRGDTKEVFFRIRTKVWDSFLGEWVAGPYKDLTGHTVASQIRATKASEEVILTFDVTIGNQADEENGRGAVLLKIDGTDTATVPAGLTSGVWDVQFTEPDLDVFTYIEGSVTFTEDVTRSV